MALHNVVSAHNFIIFDFESFYAFKIMPKYKIYYAVTFINSPPTPPGSDRKSEARSCGASAKILSFSAQWSPLLNRIHIS